MTIPKDFVPENSDEMTPEEEYELIQVLKSIENDEDLNSFVETERPS